MKQLFVCRSDSIGIAVLKVALHAGDTGSPPGLGKSYGEGNGNPLQYSCLGNSTDRGAWLVTVHEVERVRRG